MITKEQFTEDLKTESGRNRCLIRLFNEAKIQKTEIEFLEKMIKG